jgi:hypothetical protein
MIRKAISALFLIAVGAALTYYALGHHVVRTGKGHISVPKAQMGVAQTYVDIRGWERSEFEEHPELTAALLENGYEDLVPVASTERIKQWIEERAREVLE